MTLREARNIIANIRYKPITERTVRLGFPMADTILDDLSAAGYRVVEATLSTAPSGQAPLEGVKALGQLDIELAIGAEVRRRNRIGDEGEKGAIASCCEGAAAALVLAALKTCGFEVIRSAILPASAEPVAVERVRDIAEKAYGLLWRDISADQKANHARRLLLTVLDKDGQKRGIEFAIATYGPTSEAEILRIDERDPAYPPASGAVEAGWRDVSMARHWIDRYAAGIDEEPQMNRILACASVAAPTEGR